MMGGQPMMGGGGMGPQYGGMYQQHPMMGGQPFMVSELVSKKKNKKRGVVNLFCLFVCKC